jgi:hypothetical protein
MFKLIKPKKAGYIVYKIEARISNGLYIVRFKVFVK